MLIKDKDGAAHVVIDYGITVYEGCDVVVALVAVD